MHLNWRQPVVVRWHPRFVGKAGLALMVAISVPLILWTIHTWKVDLKKRQYQAALDHLSQLRLDRQRILEDLTRNKRLIAWIETRIEDAKTAVAPLTQSSISLVSNRIGEEADFDDYLKLSLDEDDLNLKNALQRQSHLMDEKSLIEQKIVWQEAMLQQ